MTLETQHKGPGGLLATTYVPCQHGSQYTSVNKGDPKKYAEIKTVNKNSLLGTLVDIWERLLEWTVSKGHE